MCNCIESRFLLIHDIVKMFLCIDAGQFVLSRMFLHIEVTTLITAQELMSLFIN